MKRSISSIAALLAMVAICFASGKPSHATFTAITDPVPLYTAITTKIDFSSTPDFTTLGSITDGAETVTFSTGMEKRTVPGSWATWGSPPDTESATPSVLWTKGATSLSMFLSTPTSIFGFEAEPNPFSTHLITADFWSGSSLLGTITRPISGYAGARLMAGTDGAMFDKIDVYSDADFAVAQVRYGDLCSPVPEPGTMSLLATGCFGAILRLRKRKLEEATI